MARKENILNQQCIWKIKDYLNSISKICEVDELNTLTECIGGIFTQPLNSRKMRRHLLNSAKILNKEESEYLYNYMTEKQFSYFIWRECFKNYLLVESSELTRIENELIIEDIII